ncbi:MAG: FIST N-terminal domain-containing protein [Patescibacteria group bacterium]|nr:FIST N-terminal domain-containing protein [Patescibacteria group bacterium]
MNTPKWVLPVAIAVLGLASLSAALVVVFRAVGPRQSQLTLVSKPAPVVSVKQLEGTEVGTGSSGNDDPKVAVEEAADMALKDKKMTPDFAAVFVNAGTDASAVFSELRQRFGEQIKIFGGTSSARAVMSDKGMIAIEGQGFSEEYRQARKGLVMMTVASKDITFGVGTARISEHASSQEAGAAALREALKSIGKTEADKPNVILMTTIRPEEDNVMAGIEQVMGKDAVILGGTAGGPNFAVFGKDGAYNDGVSIAVLFTDLPVGWTFSNSFDTPDLRYGVATKVDGMELIEIDHRPALDVLDEWLDGEITRIHSENSDPRFVRDFLAVHPLYRKFMSADGQAYFIISHPWPKDEKMVGRTLMTATHIKEGETVFLGRGSLDQIMNGIANLPGTAKRNVGMDINEQPVLALGFVCNGALGALPEEERMKLPKLVGTATGGAPYLVVYSYGEQGHLPGYGNAHANLSASFLVIGSGQR